MKEINVLLLSGGRRVELIKCFKEAAKKENVKSKIVVADISELAPAIYFGDKHYIIPRIGEEKYIETIIDIVKEENIKLIVPTIDTELKILAENKKIIEEKTDAKVLISDNNVIDICRNKINTQHFFENHNFGVPKMIDTTSDNIQFPLFIKPLDGSSSINTFKVRNENELEFFKQYIDKPIVQELIQGTEYTVDTFLDFESNPITIVPRQRIATRSGEIAKGKIVKDHEIIEDVKRLVSVLKPIGQITIQCMKTADGIKYIEINPRFGGGAPMSINAGADSCANLYRLLKGEKIQYNEYYNEYTFLRFDDSIMLNSKMEIVK